MNDVVTVFGALLRRLRYTTYKQQSEIV